MAWTNLPDADTGDILTAERVNALRDNAIAIADGLAGAPRIWQREDLILDLTPPNPTERLWRHEHNFGGGLTQKRRCCIILKVLRNREAKIFQAIRIEF